MTQGFGVDKTKPNMLSFYKSLGLKAHNGIDWLAKDGEKIYWPLSKRGQVIGLTTDSSGGLGAIILMEDNGKYYKFIFWHLKSFACSVGNILETGWLIGYADNTGMSTGTHLHFGMKECDKNGNTLNYLNEYKGAIDPTFYLKAPYVADYMRLLEAKVKILTLMVETLKKLLSLIK